MKTLLIGGPTASGKSALAVELALKLGAEVVNIDSVQCYRGAVIGSGALCVAERQGVPHHLIGELDPTEQIDVGRFCEIARERITEIHSRGKQVVVVGGTGMYVRALLHGLADIPRADPEFRRAAETRESKDLHEELRRLDPVAGQRLHLNDRQRVIRALEAIHLSGEALSTAQESHAHQPVLLTALILSIQWPREALYQRINERCSQMIEAGLVNEAQEILEIAGSASPVFKALGYSHALQFIRKEISSEEFLQTMSMDTRRFAKRQMTFWRNEPVKRGWDIVEVAEAKLTSQLLSEIKRFTAAD